MTRRAYRYAKTSLDEASVVAVNFAQRVDHNQRNQRRKPCSYKKTFEICLDDIDFNGHLHHTKYIEFAAHTRYCHLAELGWDLPRMRRHGIGAVTLAEEIHYRREVRLGDLITVTHQVIGNSADSKRWRTRNQIVRRDGAISATVTTTGAWFGLLSRRIQAPPADLVAATDAIRSQDFVVLEG